MTLNHFNEQIHLKFEIKGMDFARAGEASSSIKHTLQRIGFNSSVIRRVAIAAYEAEMNIVIHAHAGTIQTIISPQDILIIASDQGPGIDNIHLAMQEGYSTAPDHIREMGFGAGMGLPNIKKCADQLEIQSTADVGTTVNILIHHV